MTTTIKSTYKVLKITGQFVSRDEKLRSFMDQLSVEDVFEVEFEFPGRYLSSGKSGSVDVKIMYKGVTYIVSGGYLGSALSHGTDFIIERV